MHFLNRLLSILIAFVIITLIIGSFLPELRRQKEQASRLEDLKKEIATQKALLAQRTREVDLLKNDPEYVATQARDKLDMMKEGETVIRFEPQASPTPQGAKARGH